MSEWGDCRIEVIAHQDEILALAAEGYPASAIYKRLQLAGSLRSLQRWLRHLKMGKPVVSCAPLPRKPHPGFRHFAPSPAAVPSTRAEGRATTEGKPFSAWSARQTRP